MCRISSTYFGSKSLCRNEGIRSVPPATMRISLEYADKYAKASSTVRGRSNLNGGRLNHHLRARLPLPASRGQEDDARVPCRETTTRRRAREIAWARSDRFLRSCLLPYSSS